MTQQQLKEVFEDYVSMNKLRLQRNLKTFNNYLNTSHTIESLLSENRIKRLNFNRDKALNYGVDGDTNIHYEINQV